MGENYYKLIKECENQFEISSSFSLVLFVVGFFLFVWGGGLLMKLPFQSNMTFAVLGLEANERK